MLNGCHVFSMERHLELSRDMADRSGEGDAFSKLGQIAHEQGEFEEAGRFFEQARHLAHSAKQVKKCVSPFIQSALNRPYTL
jgi:uncharacterized protein HemY